jgi:hypothetical protein
MTVVLAYAERHPEQVPEMRAIQEFLSISRILARVT